MVAEHVFLQAGSLKDTHTHIIFLYYIQHVLITTRETAVNCTELEVVFYGKGR